MKHLLVYEYVDIELPVTDKNKTYHQRLGAIKYPFHVMRGLIDNKFNWDYDMDG